VAHGSQCLSFPQFVITHGSQNQAYSAHRYPQSDWNIIQHKETRPIAEKERKGKNTQFWKPIEKDLL
jgi:hypothetical protein